MLMLLQARSLDGLFEGDLDAVRSAAASGARLSREIADLYSLEMMLIDKGMVALLERDPAVAKPLFAKALGIARQLVPLVSEATRAATAAPGAAKFQAEFTSGQHFGAHRRLGSV